MTNLGFKPVLSYRSTKPHTNSTIIGEEKGNNALTPFPHQVSRRKFIIYSILITVQQLQTD